MKLVHLLLFLVIGTASCSVKIDDVQANLVGASAAEVNAKSDILKVPEAVSKVDYLQRAWQDTHEYLHFVASREVADEFARGVLGFVPAASEETEIIYSDPESRRRVGVDWWPMGPVPGARLGENYKSAKGGGQVLILDRPGHSEVWAFYTS